MNIRKGFTLIEVMIVCVIIGLLAAMAIPAFMKAREKQPNLEYYQAWVKLHRRTDLSYETWNELFRRGALPRYPDHYYKHSVEAP